MKKTQEILLKDIANWQFLNEKITLPAIQRDFVWKPYQIENLWDSILRQFPIGSFLFIKNKTEGYDLLDGQQRSTAIALGFYNPYTPQDTAFWKNPDSQSLPIVWVDLDPKNSIDKFQIRVTTPSHPWGYKSSNNTEVLSSTQRRSALELFKKSESNKDKIYTKFCSKTIFPFDAKFPIPLSFILDELSNPKEEELDKKISRIKRKINKLPESLRSKKNEITKLDDRLTDLYKTIKNLIDYKVSCDLVDKSLLECNQTIDFFIRINSAGTALTTEDQIYSIYKSHYPEVKNLVENIGANFISSTKIISIASRIALSVVGKNTNRQTKVSVSRFAEAIKDNAFESVLKKIITEEKNESLFNKAILIFQDAFDGDNKIPAILIKKFIKNNFELFYFLVYWLYRNKDYDISNQKVKQLIVGRLFLLSWFGREKKIYLDYIWSCFKTKDLEKKFWNTKIQSQDHNSWEKYPIHNIPDTKLLFNTLFGSSNKDGISFNQKEMEKIKNNPLLFFFIDQLCECKDMLMLSQRKYMNNEFAEFCQNEGLDDATTPWDLDHIYPQEWAKNSNSKIIKSWNNCIGNLRFVNFEQNRSDSNRTTPSQKMANSKDYSNFLNDNNAKYWEELDKKISYQTGNEIKKYYMAVVGRLELIYAKDRKSVV